MTGHYVISELSASFWCVHLCVFSLVCVCVCVCVHTYVSQGAVSAGVFQILLWLFLVANLTYLGRGTLD